MPQRQASIRRKLTGVILLISCTVVALTAAAFIGYEIFTFRQNSRENLSILAEVIAANCSSSLAFVDTEDAQEVLSTLKAEPHIISGVVYDREGKIFAVYPMAAPASSLPKEVLNRGFRSNGPQLELFTPVMQKELRVGTLFLRSDMSALRARVGLYVAIALSVLAGSAFLAWFLSRALQRGITTPILALTNTARSISERRDYSVRASKLSHDEIGVLTDSFNHMLDQIQQGSQALAESAQRLRLALEASRIGTWEWNLVNDTLTSDDYVPPLYGLKPEVPGNRREQFRELTHPDDRQKVADALETALKEHQELNVEYRVIWPDQSVHQLVSRGRAIHDAAGKPIRMTGVTMDVTESRQAEQARLFLAAIVESSEDAIIGKDLAGRVVSWNVGAERMFGYTASEMIGQTVAVLAPARYDEELSALHKVRRGKTVRFESIHRRKNGEDVPVAITMSPIRDSQGRIIGSSSIKQDITERKKAEDENTRLKNELEQRVSQRTAELAAANKELEAFTYSVAHDLRAPLRHMDAYASAMQVDFGKTMPPEMSLYLKRIVDSSHKMANLVDDLLNLARVGRAELKRERVQLDPLVAEVIQDFKDEMKNRRVEWKIGPLGAANCDAGLMKLVFSNLLGNALKYSRPRPLAVIEIERTEEGGESVFKVRDNGVGFDMRFAEKLFGVFQRLHRADEFEGTGVGLATVDRIVQKHGGRIWAEAELDKGATFSFTLGAAEGSNQ